jgi:hypothetical protein
MLKRRTQKAPRRRAVVHTCTPPAHRTVTEDPWAPPGKVGPGWARWFLSRLLALEVMLGDASVEQAAAI